MHLWLTSSFKTGKHGLRTLWSALFSYGAFVCFRFSLQEHVSSKTLFLLFHGSYIEFNTHLLDQSRFGHSPPWMKFQLIRTTYCMLKKVLLFPHFFSIWEAFLNIHPWTQFLLLHNLHSLSFLLFYIPFYQCYSFRLMCQYSAEGEFVCSSPLDWHTVNDMEVFQSFRT